MIVELNLANIIFIVIAAIGGVWALMKVIAAQFKREVDLNLAARFKVQEVSSSAHYSQINTRLDALDSVVKADANQWQRVERELLNLKADLPLHYVRREDYIRGQSILEAKMDGLASKIESAMLRSNQNGGN